MKISSVLRSEISLAPMVLKKYRATLFATGGMIVAIIATKKETVTTTNAWTVTLSPDIVSAITTLYATIQVTSSIVISTPASFVTTTKALITYTDMITMIQI